MKILKFALIFLAVWFVLGLVLLLSPAILFFGSIGWYVANKDKNVVIGATPLSPTHKRLILGGGLVGSLLMFNLVCGMFRVPQPSKDVAKQESQYADRPSRTPDAAFANQAKSKNQPSNQTLDVEQPPEDLPSRDELIRGVYLTAAGTALQAKIGENRATPEEFIEMTHQAARLLGADRPDNSHTKFLLDLKPNKDVSKEIEGNSVRSLHYGKEMAVFVRNKKTGKMEFISATINGSPKMNTNR